jgi:hypothetical protein
MIDMLKRHAIQVLREAGHDQADVARLVGVGIRSVRRVDAEPGVTDIDDAKERERRSIGRPSKAEPFRSVVAEILAGEPELLSVEILRRAKLKGYTGGKTALYDLIAAVRPRTVRPLVRFEGLPRGILAARFWPSPRALPRRPAETGAFLRLAVEVLALGRGDDRAG